MINEFRLRIFLLHAIKQHTGVTEGIVQFSKVSKQTLIGFLNHILQIWWGKIADIVPCFLQQFSFVVEIIEWCEVLFHLLVVLFFDFL